MSKSDEASGSAVAKAARAKLRGVKLDWEKSMLEKVIPPDVTSGALPMVVLARLQVTLFWIAVAVSDTSVGSAVLPTMKHAAARSVFSFNGAGLR